MKFIGLFSAMALAPLLVGSAHAQVAVVGGLAGCKDKDSMMRVVELTDQADLAAAQEMIARGIKSKDCRILAGDDVIIESTPPFSRLIKVHVRGNPDVYWVLQ